MYGIPLKILVHCQRYGMDFSLPKFCWNNFRLFNSILLWIWVFSHYFLFFIPSSSFTDVLSINTYAHTYTHDSTDDVCWIAVRARNIDIVHTMYWLCWGQQERQRREKKHTTYTLHRDNEMSKQINGCVQCDGRMRLMCDVFLRSDFVKHFIGFLFSSVCFNECDVNFILFSCIKLIYKLSFSSIPISSSISIRDCFQFIMRKNKYYKMLQNAKWKNL